MHSSRYERATSLAQNNSKNKTLMGSDIHHIKAKTSKNKRH